MAARYVLWIQKWTRLRYEDTNPLRVVIYSQGGDVCARGRGYVCSPGRCRWQQEVLPRLLRGYEKSHCEVYVRGGNRGGPFLPFTLVCGRLQTPFWDLGQ